jgi:enoyl-CoA hydratase/carnithine racemase
MINYEKQRRIAIFTIDRPEVKNAMNAHGMQELHDRMVEFDEDQDLWVGIITGDKTFCGGADVKEMVSFQQAHPGQYWERPDTPMRGLEIWKPLIAAVNGLALGGGLEIALTCDIRIASENARFSTPEAGLGLMPGWGGTQRLPRMIPWAKAAELLLGGKIIDAHEAYRIGLVNEVVPPSEVMPAAIKWAEAMCKLGPLALRAIKQAMVKGTSTSLEEGLQIEKELVKYLVSTKDFAEGVKAFVEKRKPIYGGSKHIAR